MKGESLDTLLASLAAAPADRPLGPLESQIRQRIAGLEQEARAARTMTPVRLAIATVAVLLGIVTGGASAIAAVHSRASAGPFDAATQLAPSTLLEGAG